MCQGFADLNVQVLGSRPAAPLDFKVNSSILKEKGEEEKRQHKALSLETRGGIPRDK
jgi:hypothetical protein